MKKVMTSSARSVRSDIISAISRDGGGCLRSVDEGGGGAEDSPLSHPPPPPKTAVTDSGGIGGGSQAPPVSMSATSLVRNPSHTYFKKEVLPSTTDLGIVEDFQPYPNHQEEQTLNNPDPPDSSTSHPSEPPLPPAALDNKPNGPVDTNIIKNQKEYGKNDDVEVGLRKQQQTPAPQQQQTEQQAQQQPTESVKGDSSQLDRDSGAPCSSDTDSRQSLQLTVDSVTSQEVLQSSQTPGTVPSEEILGVDSHSPQAREVEEKSFPRTGNLDIELELFLDKDPKEAPRSGSSDLSERAAGGSESNSVESLKERGRDKRSFTKRETKDAHHYQRPSVLRSRDNDNNDRVRSSSVGHKVRFTGQCSFGEADNEGKIKSLQHQQQPIRTSRSHSRRPKKKMERSG